MEIPMGVLIFLGGLVVILIIALLILIDTVRTRGRRLVNKSEIIERQEETIVKMHEELANQDLQIRAWIKRLQREQSAYTRYECTFCGGKGVQQVAGQVHLHPGETLSAQFPCDVCQGDGYLYKRKVEQEEARAEEGN